MQYVTVICVRCVLMERTASLLSRHWAVLMYRGSSQHPPCPAPLPAAVAAHLVRCRQHCRVWPHQEQVGVAGLQVRV